jgi:hypothetical protein
MSKRKNGSDDALRPHYDLNQLEVVAVGPGWARRSSRRVPGTVATDRYYSSHLASAKRLFSSSQIDKDLLTDFFMTFARAEYALKEAGYLSTRKVPQVQWDKFALKVGDRLLASNEPAIKQAIRYLVEHPPAKQVVKDKSLIWEPRKWDKRKPDPSFLILSVTTVRNNLFHGGKKIHGPLAERDFRLLLSCQIYCHSPLPSIATYYASSKKDRYLKWHEYTKHFL